MWRRGLSSLKDLPGRDTAERRATVLFARVNFVECKNAKTGRGNFLRNSRTRSGLAPCPRSQRQAVLINTRCMFMKFVPHVACPVRRESPWQRWLAEGQRRLGKHLRNGRWEKTG